LGVDCYVTGNDGGNAGADDIDNGETFLRSPVMDLSDYNQPTLSYYTWFFNNGGGQQSGDPNDTLKVIVTNGTGDEVILETITDSEGAWRPKSEFILSDFIDITSSMRVQFTAGDYGGGHLVEAAVDVFLVVEGMSTNTNELITTHLNLKAFPNPFNENLTIDFDTYQNFSEAELKVYNLLGQNIETVSIPENTNSITLNQQWESGIYFITIEMENQVSETLRVIKN